MDQDAAERSYFEKAQASFDGYARFHLEANQRKRMGFLTLPKDHRTLLRNIGYAEKLEAVDEAIRQ